MIEAPLMLLPVLVERIWGRRDLGGWTGMTRTPGDRPIGEAWLTDMTCGTEGGATLAARLATDPDVRRVPPLLAKLLFTAAPLSVQVHPTDAAAAAAGVPSGKDEAWHVLEASPDAMVWIGFRDTVTPDALRAAVADGSILSLMRRHAAGVGETILVPAGTVHAIGPGLVILEVQDPVDVTWRLHDHGRSRALQVDAALAVADLGRSRAVITAADASGVARRVVATAPRFVLERCVVGAGLVLSPDERRDHILVALTDGVMLDGRAMMRGMAAFSPATGSPARIAGAPGAEVALLHGGPGPTSCLAAA